MTAPSSQPARIGLFVTCLVDLFRPTVGFAAASLLEEAGCRVEVPPAQSCCGQPARRSGDEDALRAAAQDVIRTFGEYDYTVAPSASCAGVLRGHAALLADDPAWAARAAAFSANVYELTSFLVDVRGVSGVRARVAGSVTYHDCCAALRELGIREQPRRLLGSVEGLCVKEMPGADLCCGFGGAGCEPASADARPMTLRVHEAGAATLLAGDLGCLLGMAGRLRRDGSGVEVRHVAEVLAGMNDGPPIGGAPASRGLPSSRGTGRAGTKPDQRTGQT